MRHLTLSVCLLLGLASGAAASPDDCLGTDLGPKPENLAEIIKDHELWLKTGGTSTPAGARADLRNLDLDGVDLSGKDLRKAQFTGSNLRGAKLDGAKLDQAEMDCVLADNTSFQKASLFKTILGNASLISARLANSNSSGAILTGTALDNADFSKADMRRAILISAALRGTKLEEAKFKAVDLKDAVWQPTDWPTIADMASVTNLKTIRLDEKFPDISAMTRLIGELRKKGVEDKAKEVAYAREHARISVNLKKWRENSDWVALGLATFYHLAGCLTDFGLSLTRGMVVLLGWTLLFVPVYYYWGFNRQKDRKTGFSIIVPEGTLVPSLEGEILTTTAKSRPIHPMSAFGRLGWSTRFALFTCLRLWIDMIPFMEGIFQKLNLHLIKATGWIRVAALVQGIVSLILIALLIRAYSL